MIQKASDIEISTLCPLSKNYHFVRLQPHDLYIVVIVAGGQIFQMDSNLQEFDLEFVISKSKKSLFFVELLCDLPSTSNDETSEEIIVDESLFLISSSNLWYGDIIIYLQTQKYRPNTSRFEQKRI